MKSVVSICPVGAIRETERVRNVFLENALEKELEERGRGGGANAADNLTSFLSTYCLSLACSRKVPSKPGVVTSDVGTASEVTTTSFELTFLEHANSDNS